MENSAIKSLVGGVSTTAVLCYMYLGSQACIVDLPGGNHSVSIPALEENIEYNPYYSLLNTDALTTRNQIETIHNFVSTLLDNSEDINPDYSKVVDKHFWELG